MAIAPSARIHPTAIVPAEAEIGDRVEIGPFAVLEGHVRLGPECIIKPHAYLVGPLTMGRGNVVYSGAVLGERPQHLRYHDEPTALEIGDGNIFREGVTIHRGTTHSWLTRIGSGNYLMVNCHVGHDCVIGNRCILANGALLGGHCILHDNVYMSGNSALHQFVRMGRLSLLSGVSATTKDIPPFVIHQGIDSAVGVNVVGMRRAGMTHGQIEAVRRAFKVLFRDGLPLPAAVARLEHDLGASDVIQEMLAFLRGCTKGINPARSRGREEAA